LEWEWEWELELELEVEVGFWRTNMQFIEAPYYPKTFGLPIVYLGGDKGEWDWQKELDAMLLEVKKGTLFSSYNPHGIDQESQCRWDYIFSWVSEYLVFWFHQPTLPPEAMYILGTQLVRFKLAKAKIPKICIGVHPQYDHKFLTFQTTLIAKEIVIVDSLEKIKKWIRQEVEKAE
jgi:hypothetical protein